MRPTVSTSSRWIGLRSELLDLSHTNGQVSYALRQNNRPQAVWSVQLRGVPKNLIRHYADNRREPPPFETTDKSKQQASDGQSWLLGLLRKTFSRSGPENRPWEVRREGDEAEGYEPDAEWESLQVLSSLVRRIKTEIESGDAVEDLLEIEFELKEAIDDLIPRLAREEFPAVHVRLINEAWNFLYTPQLGNIAEYKGTEVVRSEDAARRHFSIDELKKLLFLVAQFPEVSEFHVELGRKIYQKLMQSMAVDDQAAQEQFTRFILLLSRNHADNEMLIAFNELLRILKHVDENTAAVLVSIINNISDERVQEVVVSRLFQNVFMDIGAFNIILQSAIEHEQRNIWRVYASIFSPEASGNSSLEPNLDTLELLFRYVVQDYESQESKQFMEGVKEALFDGSSEPSFDIMENQSLYRSYLTACIVSGHNDVGTKLFDLFSDSEMMPSLEPETWQVLAQWITYFDGNIEKLSGFFAKMNTFGVDTDVVTLNGVLRASQIGQTTIEFRDAVFALYQEYNVGLDTTSVGLRIRDRLRANLPLEAVAVFQRGVSEGLTWDYKTDDVKALFLMLQGLTTLEPFDGKLLTDMYLAVRVYVKSVDYKTRLSMAKVFITSGQIGNLRDLLKEEMGEEYKYHPDTFPELFDVLHTAVLNNYNAKSTWMIYGCLHKHFIPPYEAYLPILRHFGDLNMCEAMLEVFRHVRKGTETPPRRDMYSIVLRQFSRRAFSVGIDEVIMCYRLDLNIDPDIEMFNALLEACLTVDMSYMSYSLWQQIRLAAIGDQVDGLNRLPNSETFRLLMKIASRTNLGYAQALWQEFPKYPVQLTTEHYQYYVAALCEHGQYDQALSVATRAYELPEPQPTADSSEIPTSVADLIGVVYNYMPTDEHRNAVKEWATLVHPEAWDKVRFMIPELQTMELLGVNPDRDPLELARMKRVLEGRQKQLETESATTRPESSAQLPKPQ
ncbi:hypothetical protein V1512DRAFT_256116 [Lipomyces arxii]|uniref:uncharacterized protein n=1 Tax=Lipomyces arxii TaxID=56418 RepID=UPI0034CDFCBB